MNAILDLRTTPGTPLPGALLQHAPVTPLFIDQARAPHERASVELMGQRLANLMGRDFRARALPGMPGYFIPMETLTREQADMRGITGAEHLFGGVVPHAFVATKLISHGLVEAPQGVPQGWAPGLGEALGSAVLPGFSVFTREDLAQAVSRLLPLGRVRCKLAQARGGNGQQVVASPAALEAWMAGLTARDIATGVVAELNLETAQTFSIGQVEVGGHCIAYFGTQRVTQNPRGDIVYGGSSLRVVRGGLDQLQHVPLPAHAAAAIAKVQHYERAVSRAYPGFFASRRNYDVVRGYDGEGWEHCGVLEQSWRFGGASPAEILALETLLEQPALPWVDAMTCESWEDIAVPNDAVVYFRGEVASLGTLTKYATVSHDGRDP